MRQAITVASVLLALGLAACEDALVVENLSDPDIERVFSTPQAVQQTIGSNFQACHNAVSNTNVAPQLAMLGLETYSQLNNFNMGARSTIPRSPVTNYRGAPTIFPDYSALARAARLGANALDALDKLIEEEKTLGSPAQNLRARSFAFFTIACNMGWLAMVYDSAGIVGPGMSSDSIPPLAGAADVAAAAIALLDSSEAIATNPAATGAGGFPIPGTWLGQSADVSRDNFVRLVRSWRARYRAGVARTPQQRAAVDWAKVIADAESGITSDFTVSVAGNSNGWNESYAVNQSYQDPTWGSMTLMYFGMADVSGGYDAWLATPLGARAPFLVVTPDQRWPQGTTRAAQQAASATEPSGLASRPYIRNRTLQDSPGDPWGTSYYDFYRFIYIRRLTTPAAFPTYVKAENDLLAAEGYIRTGKIAEAAAKIDLTRVARGALPALTGTVTTATQPVPGGASCVPRVPAAPSFTSTTCGNIMEAMKWEKRMETAHTSYARWWIDGRGWGDLVEGTATEYPVPNQEMDARQLPFYPLGGGGASSAARGTYGF
jgi:hypothetical protein